MALSIYTISYVVNSILLAAKLALFCVTKENTLVIMIVDNFNDIIFSFLVSCYNKDKTILYIVVAMVSVIVFQALPVATLLMSALNVLKYPEQVMPYAISGGLLLVNAVIKGLIYYWYHDIVSLDEAAVLSDQVFDTVTCVVGVLANLLMLAVGFEHVFVVDYVVTLAIFAYTLIFWSSAIENSLAQHRANLLVEGANREIEIEEVSDNLGRLSESEGYSDQRRDHVVSV